MTFHFSPKGLWKDTMLLCFILFPVHMLPKFYPEVNLNYYNVCSSEAK